MSKSIFDVVGQAPDDPILGLNEAFKSDPRDKKVNLSIGVYSTEDGKVPLLRVVAEAEKRILEAGEPHTYLPISGIPAFNAGVQKLIFGADSPIIKEKHAVTVQSLGGTGALKVGADFLAAILKDPEAVVSTPTWQNHVAIFEQAGFKVGKYPYYDKENNGVDFPAMLKSLSGLKENTVVILHACCHNPTGYDLTQEQWAQVVDVCVKNKLIPFLDIAYQGFGDGLEEDAGRHSFLRLQLFLQVLLSLRRTYRCTDRRLQRPGRSLPCPEQTESFDSCQLLQSSRPRRQDCCSGTQ